LLLLDFTSREITPMLRSGNTEAMPVMPRAGGAHLDLRRDTAGVEARKALR
jgi:hypothetical protein